MPVFPKNLNIINGNFESSLSGWTYFGFSTINVSSLGFTHSLPNNENFAKSHGTSASSQLLQSVSVPSSATTDIDNGNVKIDLSFLATKKYFLTGSNYKSYREYDDTSRSRIQTILKFYDASATEIGSARTEELGLPRSVVFPSSQFSFYENDQIPNHDIWTSIDLITNIPANTRSIDVIINTYVSGGDNGEFIIDNVKGSLYQQENTDAELRLSEAFMEILVKESQTPQSRFTFTGIEVLSTVDENTPEKKPILIVKGKGIFKGGAIVGSIES